MKTITQLFILLLFPFLLSVVAQEERPPFQIIVQGELVKYSYTSHTPHNESIRHLLKLQFESEERLYYLYSIKEVKKFSFLEKELVKLSKNSFYTIGLYCENPIKKMRQENAKGQYFLNLSQNCQLSFVKKREDDQ